MKILDRQQFGLALGEPAAGGGALTLWTVPVATANGELTIRRFPNGSSALQPGCCNEGRLKLIKRCACATTSLRSTDA
jgi:hypothetical protein